MAKCTLGTHRIINDNPDRLSLEASLEPNKEGILAVLARALAPAQPTLWVPPICVIAVLYVTKTTAADNPWLVGGSMLSLLLYGIAMRLIGKNRCQQNFTN